MKAGQEATTQKPRAATPQSLAEFRLRLSAGRIRAGLTDSALRELGRKDEATTQFGSAAYVTRFRARSAAFTRNTVEAELLAEDLEILRGVLDDLARRPMIQVDRTMGQGGPDTTLACRLWVSEAYARLGLMFQSSLGDPRPGREPDLVVVDLPEWAGGDRRILVDPDAGITFVLGSDYYGEIKKAFLRMTMYRGKLRGGLGLHAGSKEIWARSRRTGETRRSGMLFFGLSGTGKTSLTCHDLDMDPEAGERVRVRQDDVVILEPSGYSRGTEARGFYIKTEGLSPEDQAALYDACVASEAVLENVWVEKDGRVDFFNSELTGNGRAVVPVAKVRNTDGDIDLHDTNQVFFITRNSLIPPIARLRPEQAAAAFMLGESIKTSAADPLARGEPVREVGTNPFIVGSRAEEGNRFLGILRGLPRVECFLLNTGRVGAGSRSAKIGILDTVAILREIARDGIEWRLDPAIGLEVPARVRGIDVDRFDFGNYYSPGELRDGLEDLRRQRVAWLERFPDLRPEIRANLY